MKFNLWIPIISVLFLVACKGVKEHEVGNSQNENNRTFTTDDYHLYKPNNPAKGVLVLFGGYAEEPDDVLSEFQIIEMANKEDVAVLILNFNKRLWLYPDEKEGLVVQLEEVFKLHELPLNNVTIGGFSSGGNISLLLSSYLIESHSEILPRGVFIVDSPIDLVALYQSAIRNIGRNFSEISVQESEFIVSTLNQHFGHPDTSMEKYNLHSPYIAKHHQLQNLLFLKDVHVRLYTEPDTLWWRSNRQAEFADINSYYIKELAQDLDEKLKNQNVEFIETHLKGFRANGTRHPHSWSIVDKQDLINWIIAN